MICAAYLGTTRVDFWLKVIMREHLNTLVFLSNFLQNIHGKSLQKYALYDPESQTKLKMGDTVGGCKAAKYFIALSLQALG